MEKAKSKVVQDTKQLLFKSLFSKLVVWEVGVLIAVSLSFVFDKLNTIFKGYKMTTIVTISRHLNWSALNWISRTLAVHLVLNKLCVCGSLIKYITVLKTNPNCHHPMNQRLGAAFRLSAFRLRVGHQYYRKLR